MKCVILQAASVQPLQPLQSLQSLQSLLPHSLPGDSRPAMDYDYCSTYIIYDQGIYN